LEKNNVILITGAAGKTGLAILSQLAQRGAATRAFIRADHQAPSVLQAGASEVVVGDILSEGDLKHACAGVLAIYHICPNVHPDEFAIGQRLMAAAQLTGVRQLAYHSVLHPQTHTMAHHWEKLKVEEAIFESGLDFTILQPCAYFQNLLAYRQSILESGAYTIPYDTASRLSLVDLEDVAQAAATVLIEPGHAGAIYELAGPQTLSSDDVAEQLSTFLQKPVAAEQMTLSTWANQAVTSGLPDYSRTTLLSMFDYYDRNGFIGNPTMLSALLGRAPSTFTDFLERDWVK
jgi:uncharacterized protein YbjT (DUF2867 family)